MVFDNKNEAFPIKIILPLPPFDDWFITSLYVLKINIIILITKNKRTKNWSRFSSKLWKIVEGVMYLFSIFVLCIDTYHVLYIK